MDNFTGLCHENASSVTRDCQKNADASVDELWISCLGIVKRWEEKLGCGDDESMNSMKYDTFSTRN